MTTPTITSLAPWYGSKRTLAPLIVQELGPHTCYWEPFCGSMAVLMAKPACRLETVNDLHGDLINLARVIQDRQLGPRFYRRVRRVLFHEALYAEAREAIAADPPPGDAPDLHRACAFFVASWMGRNGEAGIDPREQSRGVCVRWSATGGSPAARWRAAVGSIPAWRRRLERVTILRRDAFEVLAKIEDAEGVAIYADPPYLIKGARYAHDFADDDHRRLAEALRRFRRARVVVSYYADPRLDELYPGWVHRKIEVTKNLSLQGGGEGKKAVEVVLINGPSRASESKMLF